MVIWDLMREGGGLGGTTGLLECESGSDLLERARGG